MSITRTKRRFYRLRERLAEVHEALDGVEVSMFRQRDRLIVEIDEVLRLLSGMLEMHADHARLAHEIRERIDSTLDERNRLVAMGPTFDF